uniref:Integrase catalytic domain-containing protein n=1 Tax=Tanacetum cinerariifolium TaxID=118510 RepID=A0A699GST2_TANCI|nr:hypothetical protein [Tanacetum cinerariifolium]
MVAEDDETSKAKEIDKLMALIFLAFKKIYKPTNNNLRTSSNTKQADWRDDTDDESEDQELEAHYMYMAKLQEVSPDAADSGPIFDTEPAKDEHNVIIDSLDMSYDSEQINQNDEDVDLVNERELITSLIEKLKCEIDESKNRNKFFETSNKVLVEKLKGEIEDFKNKNKSLELSNNQFKEATNKLSKTNKLLYDDFKKSQAELKRLDSLEYASEMELKCAKIKLYKSLKDKELDKVIALENNVKVLDNMVYKTGQSVQTMNMLNSKRQTSFAKPNFLKKAQRTNPRLYDIGCYDDNLALMLASESDEVILLEKESRSKLRNSIRPFDYNKLNNLYDLFILQREKSSEQRYFLERSRLSHTSVDNGNSKESFNKQTTLLEKRMDESIPWDKKCKSSIKLFKVKTYVNMIFQGVELCKETIANRTYVGYVDPFIKNTIEANFCPEIQRIQAGLHQFHRCLNEEMAADLRYFNYLELKVDSLRSQLETQKTQFLNKIDRLSREYYYTKHMNAILGVYTELDEVTNLQFQKHAISLELELQQCKEKIKNDKLFKVNQSNDFRKEHEQYVEIQDLKAQLHDKGIAISELKKLIEKLKENSVDTKKDFSTSKFVTKNDVSKDFLKPITAQILPSDKKSILKNTNVLAPGMYKLHTEPTQTSTSQLPNDSRNSNKPVSFSTGVIPIASVSRPQLKSNSMEDKVTLNNSQGKKHKVEDHRRNAKFFMNKTFVTACNESLNAKTSNVNFVCGTCVLNGNHDKCVRNGMNSRTTMPMAMPVSTREPKQYVEKSIRKIVDSESNQKPKNTLRKLYERVRKTCSWWYLKITPSGYMWKPKSKIVDVNSNLVEIILFIVDSGCSKHMTGNLKLLINFVEKFLGTVKFRNDQIAPILGYGDLGNDLLIGSRRTDLYSITLQDTNYPNLICLMAKARLSQAWLWHRRLFHLNFDTINLLSKNDIVVGLPKLKFIKDHLCSSCEMGKAKRKPFHTKITLSSKRRLQLLHMDLCGPMRVASINGKRYVLVIVDDYSRYTWTYFLRSKDETPKVLIDFLRLVQRRLQAQVRIVRTYKGSEFLNQTLHAYFAAEGILHQTSVARTPEQNGVVKRRNQTLVEAARTMLSAAKVPLLFRAEAIATTCFT